MPQSMASDLIPLPTRTLRLGMTLPYDLFDASGKLLFARGQVLRDSPLVRSLVDGGAWVNSSDTMEYQRALAHRLDTMVMQDVPLSDIVKADGSFRLDTLAPTKVELGPARPGPTCCCTPTACCARPIRLISPPAWPRCATPH
jgi:hypothetical protein